MHTSTHAHMRVRTPLARACRPITCCTRLQQVLARTHARHLHVHVRSLTKARARAIESRHANEYERKTYTFRLASTQTCTQGRENSEATGVRREMGRLFGPRERQGRPRPRRTVGDCFHRQRLARLHHERRRGHPGERSPLPRRHPYHPQLPAPLPLLALSGRDQAPPRYEPHWPRSSPNKKSFLLLMYPDWRSPSKASLHSQAALPCARRFFIATHKRTDSCAPACTMRFKRSRQSITCSALAPMRSANHEKFFTARQGSALAKTFASDAPCSFLVRSCSFHFRSGSA
eukprot:4431269-Pleurochrysis_carterae.AAC.3